MAERSLITRRLFLRAIPPSLAVAGAAAAPLAAEAMQPAATESENDLVLRVLHDRAMARWPEANLAYQERGSRYGLEEVNHIVMVMAFIPATTAAGVARKRDVAGLSFDLGYGARRPGGHEMLAASADRDGAAT